MSELLYKHLDLFCKNKADTYPNEIRIKINLYEQIYIVKYTTSNTVMR